MSTVQKKDIAVIGMSCRFSDSDDPAAFWQNLREGKELLHIHEIAERATHALNGNNKAAEKYIKTESFIRDKESFDFSFFGVYARRSSCDGPAGKTFS